ncbi:glycosyl hydrolase [Treponema socranskii]
MTSKLFRHTKHCPSTGDAIPFFHDGTYHIFSLTPPQGTTVYPDRLRTSWCHTISKDLLHWEELPVAIHPGTNDDADSSGVWTGSVVFGNGMFHAFYTGYNIKAKYQQTICHAYSKDSITWEKDKKNPILLPNEDLFEALDWRDPYVFYNDEENAYWMILSARLKGNAITRRGCVVLYTSPDLDKWTYSRVLYYPGNTNCPECPEMYKIGSNWYLSYSRFSEYVNTIYRVSSSPFGPWRTPKSDGIGGRRFYAAKSMANDEGRRIYFAWAHDRGDDCDQGEWYWGGKFCVPHEVVQNSKGELDVKMPPEIRSLYPKKIDWQYMQIQGNGTNFGNRSIDISSLGTCSYGFFTGIPESYLFSCRCRAHELYNNFGILLKSDRDASTCLQLEFDYSMQRVSLLNLPMPVDPFWQQSCQAIPKPKMPGPDGFRVCEKSFAFDVNSWIKICLLVEKDNIDIFIDEKIAFSYRLYEKPEYELGFIAEDCNVEFCDISFAV